MSLIVLLFSLSLSLSLSVFLPLPPLIECHVSLPSFSSFPISLTSQSLQSVSSPSGVLCEFQFETDENFVRPSAVSPPSNSKEKKGGGEDDGKEAENPPLTTLPEDFAPFWKEIKDKDIPCLKTQKDYWTYEICGHRGTVRQFHDGDEYSLGTTLITKKENIKKNTQNTAADIPSTLYSSIHSVFTGGGECQNSQKKSFQRVSFVKFVCPTKAADSPPRVVGVSEISPCVYLFSIAMPSICNYIGVEMFSEVVGPSSSSSPEVNFHGAFEDFTLEIFDFHGESEEDKWVVCRVASTEAKASDGSRLKFSSWSLTVKSPSPSSPLSIKSFDVTQWGRRPVDSQEFSIESNGLKSNEKFEGKLAVAKITLKA